ncbi:sugar-binding protein [Psychroserpens sp.]|uniref:sugar-binding protein n=1 Tax=Psychroserpens sp. TaxID=2020870 RepID=UPI0039E406C8
MLEKEKDPLVADWNDDNLEIFMDEDNSGSNHQFTHNAIAYHIALDENVVDMSP